MNLFSPYHECKHCGQTFSDDQNGSAIEKLRLHVNEKHPGVHKETPWSYIHGF